MFDMLAPGLPIVPVRCMRLNMVPSYFNVGDYG